MLFVDGELQRFTINDDKQQENPKKYSIYSGFDDNSWGYYKNNWRKILSRVSRNNKNCFIYLHFSFFYSVPAIQKGVFCKKEYSDLFHFRFDNCDNFPHFVLFIISKISVTSGKIFKNIRNRPTT